METSHLLPIKPSVSIKESIETYTTHLLDILSEEYLRRKETNSVFEGRFPREVSPDRSRQLRLKAKGTSKLKVNLTEEESQEFGIKTIRIYDLVFSPKRRGILHVIRLTSGETRSFDNPHVSSLLFPGDRIQRISYGNFFNQHTSLSHWSIDWKKPDRFSEAARVYPLIQARMIEIFPFLLQENQEAVICEICGGKGDDAAAIMRLFSSRIRLYVSFDQDKKSCKEAENRLKDYPQAEVKNADLLSLPVGALPQSIDLLIGSGALTQKVLNEEGEAKDILKKLLPLIKPGGMILLTGLARQWLSIDQLLSSFPLRVHNIYDTNLGREFLVLQKDPAVSLKPKNGKIDPFYHMKEKNLSLQEALAEIGMPLESIQELDLSALSLSSEDIEFLQTLPNIRRLLLRNTEPIEEILRVLPTKWQLEQLDLSGSKVSEHDLKRLYQLFPHLSNVSLNRCTFILLDEKKNEPLSQGFSEEMPSLIQERQMQWSTLFALKNPQRVDLSFMGYSHHFFSSSLINWLNPLLINQQVRKVFVPQCYFPFVKEALSQSLPNCQVVKVRSKADSGYLFPPIKHLPSTSSIYADYLSSMHSMMKRTVLDSPYMHYTSSQHSNYLFSYEIHPDGKKMIHLEGHGFDPIAIARTKVVKKGLLEWQGTRQVIATTSLSTEQHAHEIAVIQTFIQNPNASPSQGLVPFYGIESFIDEAEEEKYSVFMEYFPFSLQTYGNPLTKLQKLNIVDDLLHGSITLHGKGIIHGDIHMGNVLLKDGPSFVTLSAALCDFGLARFMGQIRPNHTFNFLYSPPEIHSAFLENPQGEHLPSEATDVWMLGMLFAHLFSYTPEWFLEEENHFHKEASLEQRKLDAARLLNGFERASFLPEQAPLFIRSMLELDPTKRPNMCEVQESFISYLQDIFHTDQIKLDELTPSLALLLGPDVFEEYQQQVNAYTEEEEMPS